MDEPPGEVGENGILTLPPSVTFALGAVTENDSWLGGGGHFGSWKQDTVRYQGAAGCGSFNLRFYGIDPDQEILDDDGLAFNIEGFILLQELTFRIKESDLFIGGRYNHSQRLRTRNDCSSICNSTGSKTQEDLITDLLRPSSHDLRSGFISSTKKHWVNGYRQLPING